MRNFLEFYFIFISFRLVSSQFRNFELVQLLILADRLTHESSFYSLRPNHASFNRCPGIKCNILGDPKIVRSYGLLVNSLARGCAFLYAKQTKKARQLFKLIFVFSASSCQNLDFCFCQRCELKKKSQDLTPVYQNNRH